MLSAGGIAEYVIPMNKRNFLTPEYFDRGLSYDSYVGQLRNYRSFVKKLMEHSIADSSRVEELRRLASRAAGPLRATAQSEDWCGDWACNGPVLNDAFNRAGIEFRVFRGSEHPEIKAYYEDDGDGHIPAVSIWDAGGKELARWIEAPASVSTMKDEWKAERPRFMELYRSKEGNAEAEKEFARMYRDFMDTMADWYAGGKWNDTLDEIIADLKSELE